MPHKRLHHRGRGNPFRLRTDSRRLVACSLCLHVRDGGAWIETQEVIRRLRTFERADVVRLTAGLCERCQTELWLRRQGGSEQLAA